MIHGAVGPVIYSERWCQRPSGMADAFVMGIHLDALKLRHVFIIAGVLSLALVVLVEKGLIAPQRAMVGLLKGLCGVVMLTGKEELGKRS